MVVGFADISFSFPPFPLFCETRRKESHDVGRYRSGEGMNGYGGENEIRKEKERREEGRF
jgi:hypothetical protein